jgi:SNF2 family DNA or RNA helicase
MIYLHFEIDNNRIHAMSSDVEQTEALRKLPGAVWYPAKRKVSYPGTPAMAERLLRLAGEDYDATKSFQRLAQKIEAVKKAESYREATDLPPIPITAKEPTPWLHQVQAYHFIKDLPGAMLAMDMGTGKTRVAIDHIQNNGLRKALVVAPHKALEDVWLNQTLLYWAHIHKMTPIPLAEGTKAERTELADITLSNRKPDDFLLLAINYEVVFQEPFRSFAMDNKWDLVLLDESHRAKAAGGKISQFLNMLGRRSERRLCMSGTPFAQGPLDIYGQYRFLDIGIFGSNVSKFRDEYALMGGYMGYEVLGYQNQGRLEKKFYQIAFRVDDTVIDLPAQHDLYLHTRFSERSRKIYRQMDKEFVVALKSGGIATASNVLTKLLRLQQLTNGYLAVVRPDKEGQELERVGTEKRDLLEDTLRDINPDEPLVIFYVFDQDARDIREVVEKSGRVYAELSGKRSNLKMWQEGRADVIAVQVQAGSEAINLVRSKYVIFYSYGLSLAGYKQARKRVRRPGQKRPTTFIHLVVRGSRDVTTLAAYRENMDVIDYILTRQASLNEIDEAS